MATIEFHGADLVVYFNSNPANVGVDHYVIDYQCKTGTVTHRVDQAAFQTEAAIGVRSYQDTLTFAENQGAGQTRNVRVSVRAVSDAGSSSADVEDAQNSLPVLPSAPVITSTLTGVEIAVPAPTDGDLSGYVAWVGTTADFPLDAAHERYRGAANAISLQLPTDDTYFVRIAPFDAFGLDTFSAWGAQQIKRGDLNTAVGGTSVIKAFAKTQAEIDAAVKSAQSDANQAKQEVATARSELQGAVTTAQSAAESARTDAANASAEAGKVRSDLTPLITDAKKAGTDAAAAASRISTDLADEVARAKGAEGTITTKVETAQRTADGAVTSISTETTQRTDGDKALGQRIDTLKTSVDGNTTSITSEVTARTDGDKALGQRIDTLTTTVGGNTTAITTEQKARSDGDGALGQRIDSVVTTANTDRGNFNTRISDEATASSNRDAALGNRTSTVEAGLTGISNLVFNENFDNDSNGWEGIPAGLVVPASYGRRNVLRTPPTATYNGVVGRRIPITSDTQRFKLRASWRCAAETAVYYFGVVFYDENGGHVAATDGTGNYPLGPGVQLNNSIHGWLDREVVIGKGIATGSPHGGTTQIPARAVFMRPIMFLNYTNVAGSVSEVDYFTIEDVTAVEQVSATVRDEATASANRDSALGNRISTTEAKLNGDQDSTLAARIRDEATASANRDTAIANRSASLETKFNATGDRKITTVTPDMFVPTSGGNPATLATAGTYGETSNYGPFVEFGIPYATHRALVPMARSASQTFKLRARLWQTAGGVTAALWYVEYLDANFNSMGSNLIGNWHNINDGSFQTIDRDFTATFIEGVVWMRFSVLINRNQSNPGPESVPGAVTRVFEASIENITTLKAADTATNTRISDEATASSNRDAALGNRINTTEAKLNGSEDSWLAGRVRDEATASANRDSALGNRISTTEAQFRGETDSALKTLINNKRNNLALVDWWKKGASIPWGLNGGQRNEIVEFPHGGNFDSLPMPDGSSGDAWLCQADGSGHGAGGWDGGQMVRLDPDKTYRFMVPISTLGAGNRTSYWGTNGVCDLNTTNFNGNPYFAIQSNLTPNKWHLFVGYLFPRNSIGKTNAGAGVWDMSTGIKTSDGWNYCFHPDGRQPVHRAYQYYASNGAYQGFGRPIIEEVDGSELNIAATLSAAKKATQADARITDEATASANRDTALGNRISTTEAKLNGDQDSWVAARIRDEATASANRDTALSNRANTLEAQFRGETDSTIAARIRDEATTRSNAVSALTNRTSVLETSFAGNGGLILNGNFTDGADGWGLGACYWVDNPGDMQGAIRSTGNASFVTNAYIPINPSRTYRMETRFAARGYGIVQYAGLQCYDVNKNYLGNLYMPEVAGQAFGYDMYERSTIFSGTWNPASPFFASSYNIPAACRFARPLFLMNYQGYGSAGSVVDVDYVRLVDTTENQATNARITDEATASANRDNAISNRVSTTESQIAGGQDSWLAARIRDEATASANRDNSNASRSSALEARSGGSGNLLTNTTVLDYSGWFTGSYAGNFQNSIINLAGDDWRPIGENVYGVYELGRNQADAYFDWHSDQMAVRGGSFYQFYAWCAAHRCPSEVYITWYDTSQNIITYSSSGQVGVNSGGRALNNWTRVGTASVRAPDNAAVARFIVRKPATYAGNGDSYMWWFRPYFGEAREGQTEWNGFVHGSGRASINTTLARINDEATASSNRDTAIANRTASLETRAGGVEGRVSTTESAISTLNGRASSYWQVQSVAGNNRAQITVRSDSNGGAGVDIVGDVNFAGNLNVGADSGGNRMKITNQNIQVFDGNGVRRVAFGLNF